MAIQRDYHIQIGVRGITRRDIHTYLLDVWQRALADLGIPFIPVLARCWTRDIHTQYEYNTLVYGLSSTIAPDPNAILESMERVLESDGETAGVNVEVFLIARRLTGQAKRGWEALTL